MIVFCAILRSQLFHPITIPNVDKRFLKMQLVTQMLLWVDDASRSHQEVPVEHESDLGWEFRKERTVPDRDRQVLECSRILAFASVVRWGCAG